MKLTFHANHKPRSQKALEELKSLYGAHAPEEADCIVTLGGDGTMLSTLHKYKDLDIPIFGLNLGTLGFLMNLYDDPKKLITRIENANTFEIHPLRMIAIDKDGKEHRQHAFNEVSLLRETHNAAKIKIFVNDKERIEELVCDGIMVATPVGSTAYNLSAGGPIIPLNANVLPVTPISAFRPRRWPGAVVSNSCEIRFEILKAVERPVSVAADSHEFRDIKSVTIRESRTMTKTILYDPDSPLEERIFQEQFAGHC